MGSGAPSTTMRMSMGVCIFRNSESGWHDPSGRRVMIMPSSRGCGKGENSKWSSAKLHFSASSVATAMTLPSSSCGSIHVESGSNSVNASVMFSYKGAVRTMASFQELKTLLIEPFHWSDSITCNRSDLRQSKLGPN